MHVVPDTASESLRDIDLRQLGFPLHPNRTIPMREALPNPNPILKHFEPLPQPAALYRTFHQTSQLDFFRRTSIAFTHYGPYYTSPYIRPWTMRTRRT